MKVLVTGADGFIGSHLVEKLVQLGYNVKAFTYYNSFNSWGWLDSINKKVLKNVEIVSGDIRDSHFVLKNSQGVDAIFHLASLIAIPYSYQSPLSYIETNVVGVTNLLESAKINKRLTQFIHTSTSEVYGTAMRVPIDENHPLNGQSPYSATKIAADQMAISYNKSFGIPLTTIRPFNTYGPRQSLRAVIPTIITQLLNDKPQVNLGSLSPTRDFNFIEDTVDGFISAIGKKRSIGETINIGSGYEISISDLVKSIGKIMNTDYSIKKDKKRIRPKDSEVNRLICDNSKADKILKWKPKYFGKEGLVKGLEKTTNWFTDQKNLNKYRSHLYNI